MCERDQVTGQIIGAAIEVHRALGPGPLESGYRIDLLVEERVVVELKSPKAIEPIHRAQLLTYSRLAEKEVGLLINFNVAVLEDGIHRLISTGTKTNPV